MKRLVVLLLLSFGMLAMTSRADVELSFDFFHDELSPLGEWAEVDGYGYVWHPSDVDDDWSPYTDGYWTYTDAGWTWVSYEDWGGICYHYGRWVRLNDYGWCWVPGYKWGPAWVSWRKNDDYVGWAPLPPECDWDEDRGVGVWVDATYEIGPSYYSFCHTRDFGAPVLRHVLLPRIRNVEICFGTVNITSISYNRDYGCAFNGGFDYGWIRERCHRPVPTLKLVQNTTNIYINGNRGNIFVNSPRGNALIVAAPRIANRTNFNVATRQVAVKRKFQRAAITKGWNGLDKDATRDRLLVKMREETKGLNRDNAPARRVRTEELAVVPKTADFKAKPVALTKIPEERRNPAGAAPDDNDRKGQANRPNRLDRDGDGRPDAARGGSAEGGVLPPGRGRGNTNEKPVATTDQPEKEPAGGLRRRPGREGAQAETDAPDKKGGIVKQPDGAPIADQPGADADKPGRRVNPRDRGNDVAGDNDAPGKGRAAHQDGAGENAQRPGEMKRDAQENAARENAERVARQRERAAEVQREGAQENAQRAAEAAAARRAKTQEADNNAERGAAQKRREAMAERQAENAERAQAERAQAQREAAQENARRQAAEQQKENQQRRMIQERQENAERAQRAAAAQEQQARAAAANRERAMEAQRERAAEANRERAMEQQQRAAQAQAQQRAAAAAANRERAMEAQRQQAAEANRERAMEQQQRAAQAQAQQRAAAQAQQRAQAQQPQRQQGGGQRERGNGRGKKGEE